MSTSYIYFVASLPMVSSIDSECPMSFMDFLEQCRQLITGTDFAELDVVLREDGAPVMSKNSAVNKIADGNRDFRNALVWFRAVRAGHDPLEQIRGDAFHDPFWADVVNRALKLPNLLEGKRLIDRTRWQVLDDFVSGHFFDLPVLIVYGLKLKILERYQVIRSEKGLALLSEWRKMDVLAEASESLR
jgi:hypothetical protein